jgi:hypothetical protein
MNKNPFLKLLDYNLELTKKLEMTPVNMDEKFIEKKAIDDSCTLYNYCFENKDFRKARFTYFDGDSKYQYFGMVLHPRYNYEIPIFNFEIILYNNDKLVYTLNMVKMENCKLYNEKYVKPFMKIKEKYPDLKENLAVKLSGYNVMGNYISEAILIGRFFLKNKDEKTIDEIYNNIVISSYTDYILTYLDFFDKPVHVNSINELENIKNRHKLFDMKKAFVESSYDIRKCFEDEWYRDMLYNFFYKLEIE